MTSCPRSGSERAAALDAARFDVIVVGGGVAGCVVAAVRHAHGERVLIVEAGRPDAHQPVPPVDIGAALVGRSVPGLMARRTPAQGLTLYLAGHGLGGGSLVNGCLYDDPNGLAPLDLPGVDISRDALAGASSGIRRLVVRDRRTTFADLVSTVEVLHANVTRISDDGRTPRVELDDGRSLRAGEIVVCAGALATPRLLAASGFEHPDLGRRLRDHAGLLFSAAGHRLPMARRIGDDGLVTSHGDTVAIVLLATNSEGWLADDHAELRLLDNPHDLRALRGLIRRVLVDLPEAVGPDGVTGAELLRATDAELDEWLLRNEGGVYHACGTAAVGRVTDESGRLRPGGRVRVADASGLAGLPTTLLMSAVVAHSRAIANSR